MGLDSCLRRNDYNFTVFNSSEAGFTLVELMITMVVFLLVIAAASQVFTGLLTQFKQQSKIAETNIEGIIGLEILRQDIQHAGYGLPWNLTGVTDSDSDGNFWEHLTNYYEAKSVGTPNPADFNDGNADTGTNGSAPRAILSGNNIGMNSSDYLVIKSTNVATNATAQKWTFLYPDNTKKTWDPDCENVNKDSGCITNNTVKIIVVSPGITDTNRRSLVVRTTDSKYYTQYNDTSGFQDSTDNIETRFIYGISTDATSLRMPFNRADYFVRRPTTNMPSRCAPGTGVLYKATVNHSDGEPTELPLLDCVADMQVGFGVDTDATPDGQINCYTNNLANVLVSVNAQNVRERVKEIRVYILAHEGQRDVNYTFNNFSGSGTCATCIRVGDAAPPGGVCEAGGILGQDFPLNNITNYLNYRWKVYTIVVKPNNLR
jgi:prepilin-type N-terminal cleavage/methylation domain-containing protein